MILPVAQILIITIMWGVMYSLKFKKKLNQKTLSPFECGYNSMFTTLPLSIQFTMLLFMFLLFDIELGILISSMWNPLNLNKSWIMTMGSFLMFMVTSIIYEMMKKSFKWN